MIDYIIDRWGNLRRYFQSDPILKKKKKKKKKNNNNHCPQLNLISQFQKLKDCDMVVRGVFEEGTKLKIPSEII